MTGAPVGTDVLATGAAVSARAGVGLEVGPLVGTDVPAMGELVGTDVAAMGELVGPLVGTLVGEIGTAVGSNVGATGALVAGCPVGPVWGMRGQIPKGISEPSSSVPGPGILGKKLPYPPLAIFLIFM